MTRAQLEAVHDALTEIIDSWNDAAADDDRGRSHDALCLTIDDDGSGRIGRRATWDEGRVEVWHDFNNMDELLQWFIDEGIEVEP